jgi:hypothetical protein
MREIFMRLFSGLLPTILLFPAMALVQQGNPQQGAPCMPGMSMPGSEGADLMTMQPHDFLQEIVRHTTLGHQ